MSGEDIGLMPAVLDDVLTNLDQRSRASAFFDDPAAWVEYMTGMTLWSAQAAVARSVVVNRSVAVKAAHGVGKSHLAALLICWWIDTRYPRAFVASTAPSQAQISAIVWRYVRQIKDLIDRRYKAKLIDHKLPGYITSDNQWKEDGGNILGFGRKPPENKEDDSFQGIHDGYVLAIGDEAVGLTPQMIDALGNITSNEGSRRVLICNPTNPGSYVGKLFREQTENWTFHTISVFDSPNFTDEKHKMSEDALSKLVGPSYAEDKAKEYGTDSPRYKSRVLGEFAYDLGDTLIKPEDIAKAIDREIDPIPETPVVLGVDIARFGNDSSVVYSCIGGKVRFVDSWDDATTVASAQRIHRIAQELGAVEVRIDAVGIGGGVVDVLVSEERFADANYLLIPMDSATRSPDRRQWHNARAWWWDSFRSGLRMDLYDLDPSDERLHDELMSVEYKFNPISGGLVIESKDDMRKRGQKSPDFADAAVYAAADLEWLTGNPLNALDSGAKVYQRPEEMVNLLPDYIQEMGSLL